MGEAGSLGENPRVEGPKVMEADRGGRAYERVGDEGVVGTRESGCCRIRRRPDIPSPRSCSAEMGDLVALSREVPASNDTRSLPSPGSFFPADSRSPVLRFLGNLSISGGSSGLSSLETI